MVETAPELGFDDILVRLREVVARLESGELSLEQSLATYEEGVQLARRGQHLLATAERRVEILVNAAGQVEAVPFDDPVADAPAEKPGRAGRSSEAGTRGSKPGPG